MRIKNWERFQHYQSGKNAIRPEWCKLYRKLLDDIQWHDLEPLDAKALVMLWMLASETGGKLPTTREIAFRLHLKEDQIISILQRLTHWVDGVPSPILGEAYADPMLEENKKEEGEQEQEERGPSALAASGYPFRGQVIKLNQGDYDRWVKAYRNLDLDAELIARDIWLSENPDRKKTWFASTSKYLANRNMEARAHAPQTGKRESMGQAAMRVGLSMMEQRNGHNLIDITPGRAAIEHHGGNQGGDVSGEQLSAVPEAGGLRHVLVDPD